MTTDPARRLGRVPGRPGAAPGGFTLVELLVVVAIVAIASAAVALAVRDPAAAQLEREAARLAVLLEAARAEARASGQPVLWVPAGVPAPGAADSPSRAQASLTAIDPNAPEEQGDFRFLGLPPTVRLPQRWLGAEVTAEVIGSPTLLLGPEPLIGAQQVALSLGDRRLVLATDGLGPFAVVETDLGSGEARP